MSLRAYFYDAHDRNFREYPGSLGSYGSLGEHEESGEQRAAGKMTEKRTEKEWRRVLGGNSDSLRRNIPRARGWKETEAEELEERKREKYFCRVRARVRLGQPQS